MVTEPVTAEPDDCIVAVDSRTGEAFFTAAYVLALQQRIAELETQQSKDAPA